MYILPPLPVKKKEKAVEALLIFFLGLSEAAAVYESATAC